MVSSETIFLAVKRPPVSALEAHVGYWLRFVSNHVSQAFARKLEAEGVSVAEWVALRELMRLGGTAPSALADHMGMTRGAISKILERLATLGLVTRESGAQDRRTQRVALSRTGRALVPRLAARADENDHEFFSHLTPAERDALIALLRDVAERNGLKAPPLE